jgi:hypothetical protein
MSAPAAWSFFGLGFGAAFVIMAVAIYVAAWVERRRQ